MAHRSSHETLGLMGLKEWAAATEGRETGDPRPGEGATVRVILGITYSPILRSRALSLWGERWWCQCPPCVRLGMEAWAH